MCSRSMQQAAVPVRQGSPRLQMGSLTSSTVLGSPPPPGPSCQHWRALAAGELLAPGGGGPPASLQQGTIQGSSGWPGYTQA